jgi:hypothetical protein
MAKRELNKPKKLTFCQYFLIKIFPFSCDSKLPAGKIPKIECTRRNEFHSKKFCGLIKTIEADGPWSECVKVLKIFLLQLVNHL